MRIEIEKPLFYKRKGDYMLPESSEMSAESKLFITSNDARFAGALAEAVNEKLANRRNIDVEEINSIIDDCLSDQSHLCCNCHLRNCCLSNCHCSSSRFWWVRCYFSWPACCCSLLPERYSSL